SNENSFDMEIEANSFNNELSIINNDILNEINRSYEISENFLDQNNFLNYSEISENNSDNETFDIDFLELFDSNMNEEVLNENLDNLSFSEISEISENFNSNNDEICNLSPEFINGLHLLNIKKDHNLTKQAFNDIMNTFIGSKMSLYRVKKKLTKL
ncbi:10094_t:CDS:2, partial [Cetraspora pellucida]